jgi:hypothetical protein
VLAEVPSFAIRVRDAGRIVEQMNETNHFAFLAVRPAVRLTRDDNLGGYSPMRQPPLSRAPRIALLIGCAPLARTPESSESPQ